MDVSWEGGQGCIIVGWRKGRGGTGTDPILLRFHFLGLSPSQLTPEDVALQTDTEQVIWLSVSGGVASRKWILGFTSK